MATNSEKQSDKKYLGGTVLSGLDGVRTRLSMYIGSTGVLREGHMPRALVQMMQEVVSNSADEYLAGYGKVIEVVLNKDGSMTVTDHGRGIPKGPGKTFDNVIDMLTKTHASGKFDDANYAAVGTAGMNGIGLKAVNAGSEWLEIEARSVKTAKRGDKIVDAGGYEKYRIRFKQADVIEKKILEASSSDNDTYTSMTFKPDGGPISAKNSAPVLASTEWVVGDIEPRLKATAFLMDGLEVRLRDEREGHQYENSWKYEHGIEDYLEELLDGSDVLSFMKKPVSINTTVQVKGKDFSVRAAFTWTDDMGADITSFANGVPTPEGGPHMDGFKDALTEAFRTFAEGVKGKGSSKRLDESDVIDGLVAVFQVLLPSDLVDFEGQTKEKLGTVEAKEAVSKAILETMPAWFFNNDKIAKQLVAKMRESQDARAAAMKAKREAKAARKASGGGGRLIVSSKLKSATSKDPKEKELFVVEGDSASKIGRNPKTQAVFPLRGKILNAYRTTLSKALSNVEISTIASVIGAGVGPAFSVDDMEYDKVIITTDSDVDGAHIRMLLIGIFWKLFPGLIEDGHLYIARPPLYKASRYVKGKREVRMFVSEEDMSKHRHELKGWDISRYKGLGEMSIQEAHESICNPATRHLMRVTPGEAAEDARMLKVALGKDSDMRYQWIRANVNFDSEDGI